MSRTAAAHTDPYLHRLALPIERDPGWNFAEITAGGVITLQEIDYRTMASRKVPGLLPHRRNARL